MHAAQSYAPSRSTLVNPSCAPLHLTHTPSLPVFGFSLQNGSSNDCICVFCLCTRTFSLGAFVTGASTEFKTCSHGWVEQLTQEVYAVKQSLLFHAPAVLVIQSRGYGKTRGLMRLAELQRVPYFALKPDWPKFIPLPVVGQFLQLLLAVRSGDSVKGVKLARAFVRCVKAVQAEYESAEALYKAQQQGGFYDKLDVSLWEYMLARLRQCSCCVCAQCRARGRRLCLLPLLCVLFLSRPLAAHTRFLCL